MASDKDILQSARERYSDAEDGWSQVKTDYLEDYRFSRLGEQWPVDILQRRRTAGRPALTINRMPPFIRQVVNSCRQSRPSVSVRPVDSHADVKTAEIMAGLIRNIEAVSNADIAYDTAVENVCSGGFGFVGIEFDYACDDTFDMDLRIRAYPNPLAVLWDPLSEAEDSSDWDYAFVSEEMQRDAFLKEYPDADADSSNFVNDAHLTGWFEKEMVRIAQYYEREKVPRKIVLLVGTDNNSEIVDAERYADPGVKELFDQAGFRPARERSVESYRITQRLITGKEVLDTKSWRASSIPLIPMYGDQINVEGRRYFRSMIHDAIDAQRIHNYSRSTATEVVSLSPRGPFLGEAGTFDTDREKWNNINQENYPFIEYKKGTQRPERPEFSGIPDGAMNEAAAALEDMKFIIGVSNPALGVPDNRVISGKAKRMERQESDMSTFHIPDNQNRMIRAVGKCLLEMIPEIYDGPRIVRVLGQDGKAQTVPINQNIPGSDKVFDITVGKYDLVIESGPSYSTKREESAEMITSFMSAAPQTAPVLGPMLAKMSDWPEAEKVSQMLATMMPPAARAVFDGTPPPPPQPPPEVLAEQAKAQADMAIAQQKAQLDSQLEQQRATNKASIERTQAEADIEVMRLKAAAEIQIEREKATVQLELKRQEAQLSAELKLLTAAQPKPQGMAAQ